MPAATISGLLRPASKTCTLESPYHMQQGVDPAQASVHMYWLGFVAASGRVRGQNNRSVLVMAVHPDDTAHIQTLLQDLVGGYVLCEFADSNLDGLQAYLRDRQLAEVLQQWGLSATQPENRVPLEYIPRDLAPHFVRGYLEGSRLTAPFGGHGGAVPQPRRSLAIAGSAPFLDALARLLRAECGARSGPVIPFGSSGLSQIVFPPAEGRRVLEYAYRDPTRTAPRAARFVAVFGQRQKRGRKTAIASGR